MSQEKEEQPLDQLDRDSSLVMVMILVHNMLKLDYTMQVNPHPSANTCLFAPVLLFELISVSPIRKVNTVGSSFFFCRFCLQEKIVMSLSLKSSSTELQSYCLMWDLRPYVDGKVMDLAWKSCPWNPSAHGCWFTTSHTADLPPCTVTGYQRVYFMTVVCRELAGGVCMGLCQTDAVCGVAWTEYILLAR
jgi:hypothetical protein